MVGIRLFPFGAQPIFKCCFAVSFRECKFQIFSIGSLDIAIGSVWFQFVQCFLLRTLQRCHMKIFVDTDDDVRLARRIRRDTVERALGQRIDTDLTWGKSTSCLEKLQVNVFHLFFVESILFVFCFWQRYQPIQANVKHVGYILKLGCVSWEKFSDWDLFVAPSQVVVM